MWSVDLHVIKSRDDTNIIHFPNVYLTLCAVLSALCWRVWLTLTRTLDKLTSCIVSNDITTVSEAWVCMQCNVLRWMMHYTKQQQKRHANTLLQILTRLVATVAVAARLGKVNSSGWFHQRRTPIWMAWAPQRLCRSNECEYEWTTRGEEGRCMVAWLIEEWK